MLYNLSTLPFLLFVLGVLQVACAGSKEEEEEKQAEQVSVAAKPVDASKVAAQGNLTNEDQKFLALLQQGSVRGTVLFSDSPVEGMMTLKLADSESLGLNAAAYDCIKSPCNAPVDKAKTDIGFIAVDCFRSPCNVKGDNVEFSFPIGETTNLSVLGGVATVTNQFDVYSQEGGTGGSTAGNVICTRGIPPKCYGNNPEVTADTFKPDVSLIACSIGQTNCYPAMVAKKIPDTCSSALGLSVPCKVDQNGASQIPPNPLCPQAPAFCPVPGSLPGHICTIVSVYSAVTKMCPVAVQLCSTLTCVPDTNQDDEDNNDSDGDNDSANDRNCQSPGIWLNGFCAMPSGTPAPTPSPTATPDQTTPNTGSSNTGGGTLSCPPAWGLEIANNLSCPPSKILIPPLNLCPNWTCGNPTGYIPQAVQVLISKRQVLDDLKRQSLENSLSPVPHNTNTPSLEAMIAEATQDLMEAVTNVEMALHYESSRQTFYQE